MRKFVMAISVLLATVMHVGAKEKEVLYFE